MLLCRQEVHVLKKIYLDEGAEKFVFFKLSDDSFALRSTYRPYHKNILNDFEKEARREDLRVVDYGGAKLYVTSDRIRLFDGSAAWGSFPDRLIEPLFTLLKEEFPDKTILDNLD